MENKKHLLQIKNMKKSTQAVIIYLMIVIVFVGGLVLGTITYISSSGELYFFTSRESEKNPFKDIYTPSYEYCRFKELETTVNCLHNFIEQNYNYQELGHTDRTIEDILERGGNCYDWSRASVKMAQNLGFKAYTTHLSLYNGEEAHMFAIIYNEGQYCILDQGQDVYCSFKD